MRLLVLGGTAFLGRAVVEAAVARGDEVTIFTRGRTHPELFPGVDRRRGDRDGGLGALADGSWDAVLDTSGYVPRVVGASAQLLRGRVGTYAFVSSVSVYADLSRAVDEDAPTAELIDEAGEDVAQHYGALKAACEREVKRAYGDAALVVRPGLIVGANDPTGRFTYWPHRAARGGDLLVPGPPERPLQLLDVRDLAEWILGALDGGVTGTYNAAGSWTFGDLVASLPGDARPVWVDDAFLLEHGVGEWTELPLWIGSPEYAGTHAANARRAIAAGLTFRPLPATARDALEQAVTVDGVGLTGAREQELLAAWGSR